MNVLQYRDTDRVVTAILIKRGRKCAHLTWIDVPVRIHKVPLAEMERYSSTLDYPLRKAVRGMLSAGKNLGITKSAKRELRALLTTD